MNNKEAAIGIQVAIDHIAILRREVIEQSVLLEKLLALQKDMHVQLGRPAEAIEERLRAIDDECHQRVLDRLRPDPKSAYGSGGESPHPGAN